jgi:hypothetical protein
MFFDSARAFRTAASVRLKLKELGDAITFLLLKEETLNGYLIHTYGFKLS